MLIENTLDWKIEEAKRIIKDAIIEGDKQGIETVVAFSGGRDSTILLDIARQVKPDMTAVFSNTTNEDKRVIDFVKSVDNVEIVNP